MSVSLKLRSTAVLVLLLAAAAAASACSSPVPGTTDQAPVAAPAQAAPAQAASNVPAGAPEGTAASDGKTQRISVGTSQGFWDPSVIHAVAGVPLEITFAEGRGCLASVLIPDFGIDQDLRAGGAVVKLPAMKAGSYEFSCGMEMVYGKIVVQ